MVDGIRRFQRAHALVPDPCPPRPRTAARGGCLPGYERGATTPKRLASHRRYFGRPGRGSTTRDGHPWCCSCWRPTPRAGLSPNGCGMPAAPPASVTVESIGFNGPLGPARRLPLHPSAVARTSSHRVTKCQKAGPRTSRRGTRLPRRRPMLPHAKRLCSQYIRGPRGAALTHVLLSTPSVCPKQAGSGHMVQNALRRIHDLWSGARRRIRVNRPTAARRRPPRGCAPAPHPGSARR